MWGVLAQYADGAVSVCCMCSQWALPWCRYKRDNVCGNATESQAQKTYAMLKECAVACEMHMICEMCAVGDLGYYVNHKHLLTASTRTEPCKSPQYAHTDNCIEYAGHLHKHAYRHTQHSTASTSTHSVPSAPSNALLLLTSGAGAGADDAPADTGAGDGEGTPVPMTRCAGRGDTGKGGGRRCCRCE